LLKILAGAVQPDEGELTVAGERQVFRQPHDATLAGLAFVHQELALVGDLSVAENIFLGLGYPSRGRLVQWSRLYDDARAILGRLDAQIRPEAPARTLTPIEQRLVMIARGLAFKIGLIALDEPSAALPQEEIAHLHAVVRTLAADGIAVIYVSHRLDEILSLTQRVVVMRDGSIVTESPTSELTHADLVKLVTGDMATSEVLATKPAEHAPTDDAPVVMRVARVRAPRLRGAIAFDVRAGEILGIAGLVGSGRTELLRSLYGADSESSSDIVLDGRSMTIRSQHDAIREGIVLLPEDRRREGNILGMTVRSNLTLASLKDQRAVPALPFPSAARERRTAQERIKDLRIRPASDEAVVRNLSGGNQQKVMIGRWLGRPSRVLLFDEPTQGIDVGAKQEVFGIISQLTATGSAVILVSSDFSELIANCHRILVLREGRLVGELRGSDINETRLLHACYAQEVAA
jgi:ABC-type sugar transport system ATPase subunit